MRELKGKVVIVTGASKGMGRHFADALAAAGCRVALVARSSPELHAVAEQHHSSARAFPCDVADPQSVRQTIAAIAEHFGQIDVLVNNAAIFEPFLIEEATDLQVERHIAVNLLGPIWCVREAIPHLRQSKGQVVTISSESVRMPFPFLTVYAATKAAIETLSAGLRDELREQEIRVSVLRSGSVAGGSGGLSWDPVVAARFFETIQRTGHAAFTGDFADPQTMAHTLVSMLGVPRDVNIDLVEARAARAASPTSLDRSGSRP